MRINKVNESIKVDTENYIFKINRLGIFEYLINNQLLIKADILSSVDTINQNDKVEIKKIEISGFEIIVHFISSVWQEEYLCINFYENYIAFTLVVKGSHKITDLNYLNIKSGYNKYIAPRFDWSQFPIERNINEMDVLSCQQWLSPPPFAMVLKNDEKYQAFGVMAKPGENNYERMLISNRITLCFEGHLEIENEKKVLPSIILCPYANNLKDSLINYVELLKKNDCVEKIEKKDIPEWWNKPIFCGWGQMRYDYRVAHDGHENGNFVNVTDYCNQYRYEKYIHDLESNGINPKTIIIDMGWAKNVALGKEDKYKWPDIKSFIKKEHSKGRHVLLWYSPLITQGLDLDCCITLNNRAVAPDPTNEKYIEILRKEIKYMLSELDADGFKIDFTQNTPSEEDIFTTYINSFWGLINENNENHLYPKRSKRKELIKVSKKNVWGVELLKLYIKNIYDIMKKIKKDSLLITHTCNPYFSEVVDMLRLNDLDGESKSVLNLMQGRAMLASISCDKWLIDTDNDLMLDLKHWREYIKLQPKLGVPDTYYSSHIAMSGQKFCKDDYSLLKEIFESYEASI